MRHFNLTTAALASLSFCVLSACATAEKSVATAAEAPTPTKTTANDVAPTKTATTDTKKVAKDGSQQICKKRKVTGSRFPKKICASADEWEARAIRDRNALDDIQQKTLGVSGTN